MSSINILPVGNKLIVKADPKKEKTEGGIIIPESATDAVALTTGTVIAVSKDLPEFEIGQRILFVTGSGVALTVDGIDYRFLEHQAYNSAIWGIEGEPKLSIAK